MEDDQKMDIAKNTQNTYCMDRNGLKDGWKIYKDMNQNRSEIKLKF